MISVIIPTLNAESCIGQLLLSLQNQSEPVEVVIIDSSSVDRTVKIAESCKVNKILTIKREDFNHGATRNLGARIATGDIVVYLTQDALPLDKHCVENLVLPLNDLVIAASYGRHLPRENAMPTEKFARLFNYPEKSTVKGLEVLPEIGIKTFFFSNVCSAIRKKEFEEAGSFPENVTMFEDMVFAAKLLEKGYKIAYVAEAKVLHSHNYSLKEQFRRYFAAGISFRNNRWFLGYAKTGNEGMRFLQEEIRYLCRNRMFSWVAYALVEALFKYAGYTYGLNRDKISFN